MAATTEVVFSSVIFLSLFKCCSAYCYGYCWYGSWYIWFAVIMTLAICCGALGSYLRRRQIQKALQRRQAEVVTVQVAGGVPGQTTEMARPYIYPAGTQGAYPGPPGGVMMTPPDYNMVAGDDSKGKNEGLPPSYTEAVAHGAYTNQNLQMSEGATPMSTAPQVIGGPLPAGEPQAGHPYPTQPPYPTQQPPYPIQPPYPTQSPYPSQPINSPTVPLANNL